MASVLTYDGIPLFNLKTIDFTQKPQFSDDKTSYLWDEIHIHVSGWINQTEDPALPDETPETTYARIKTCLTAKGKTLTFATDGANVVSVIGPDAKFGPVPGSFSIKKITTATWEYEYDITTWVSMCCGTNTTPNCLLANRWVDSVSIDQNHYSTWTRKGKLYFRYDLLLLNPQNATSILASADAYRRTILASCPPKQGFYRTKMEFSPSSDWLTYDYTIEDKENYAMPIALTANTGQGAAITDWTGTYRAVPFTPTLVKAELNIELTGNKAALKSEMYQVAAKMSTNLLNIRKNWKGAGNIFPAAGYFEHDLHENKVKLSVKVTMPHQQTTLGGFTVPFFSVSRTSPLYTGQDGQVPNPGSRGTARLALLSSVIQDPCQSSNVNGPGFGIPFQVNPLNAVSNT